MRREGVATVVAFGGEADIAGVGPLREALAKAVAAGAGPVVVDLSDTHFIDSSGMAVLLNALRRLTRQGRRMALVAHEPGVVRALELAQLLDTLRLQPRLDEALASVRV